MRRACERTGVGGEDGNVSEREEFNNFIREIELEEVLCVRRKFTWYQPNGRARSKLDKMLASREWYNLWSGCTQYILDRNVSDH